MHRESSTVDNFRKISIALREINQTLQSQSNEILENSSSEFSEDIEIRRWTIESRDGTYKRSYQEKINSMQNTNWIVGIKYADSATFEKYKKDYILFKSSLKQYAD